MKGINLSCIQFMLSTPESVNTIFVKENSLLIIKIIYVSLIKLKELCLLLSILLLFETLISVTFILVGGLGGLS